ncbi:MAG: FkbM family methyltransferase [Proteobacteria bacterium]|nr:FkbM family methyltransferase [Pseudomonadota bacterium]
MAMTPSRDLIFDVGFFDGSDTDFYLRKGFRVVAVEARPDLCALARTRFADALRSGRLILVERAIWRVADSEIAFYVRSGWSSVYQTSAERDGGASERIDVRTTTLAWLIGEFGVPHYLKCDIEGAEQHVLDDLDRLGPLPRFISLEDPDGMLAARLAAIGYDSFQIVNQGHLGLYRPHFPAREGGFVDVTFTGRSSGLFGHELARDRWVDLQQLRTQIALWHGLRNRTVNPIFGYLCRRWGKLTRRGWLIPGGWIDVHASTAAVLRAPRPDA